MTRKKKLKVPLKQQQHHSSVWYEACVFHCRMCCVDFINSLIWRNDDDYRGKKKTIYDGHSKYGANHYLTFAYASEWTKCLFNWNGKKNEMRACARKLQQQIGQHQEIVYKQKQESGRTNERKKNNKNKTGVLCMSFRKRHVLLTHAITMSEHFVVYLFHLMNLTLINIGLTQFLHQKQFATLKLWQVTAIKLIIIISHKNYEQAMKW